MRLRKIILLLLLLPLSYGLAFGYAWYQVKSTADEVVKMASPFAEIRYGAVHVALAGNQVGLDNVVIKPVMSQEDFRIEKLRFTLPHAGYLISTGMSLVKGELPERLGMQVEGMRLDLNSEAFAMLEQVQQQQAVAAKPGDLEILADLNAIGCGEIDAFTLEDYRKMGVGIIMADLGIDFVYDKGRNTAIVSANANAAGLHSLNVQTEVVTGPSMSMSPNKNGIPKLTVTYRDTGYYKLRNAYCGGLNESSEEDYVAHHIQAIGNKLGARFPDEAVTAYKRYMLKGGAVDIRIDPSTPVDPASLHFYTLADIIDMLRVDLSINGQALEFDKVQWSKKRPRSTASRGAAKVQKPPRTATPQARPRPTGTQSTTEKQATPSKATPSKVIRLAEAEKYIDSMLEVTTGDGKVRKGVLEKVTDRRLYLVIKLSVGSLSYPVEVHNITRLRVID